jgi:hypothetical protein
MPGRFHYSVSLPDGRVVIADYREPIVGNIHALNRARALDAPPRPDDLAAVAAWLDANVEQVAACGRGDCGHDV